MSLNFWLTDDKYTKISLLLPNKPELWISEFLIEILVLPSV